MLSRISRTSAIINNFNLPCSVKFDVLVSSFSLSFISIYVVSFVMAGECPRQFLFLVLLSLVISIYILSVYSPILITGYTKQPKMYWPAKLKGMITRYIEILWHSYTNCETLMEKYEKNQMIYLRFRS